MRTFLITHITYATLHLDDEVIDAVDDEWRSYFYPLYTPREIAGHVGSNLIQGVRLSQLDGFADLPDSLAVIEIDDEETDVEEQ